MLDPLQVNVAEAGTRHPLQAMHIVLIDLHAKDLRVALNVVPLGVGLQRLLNGGILEPCRQFGRVDQVVDDTLKRRLRKNGSVSKNLILTQKEDVLLYVLHCLRCLESFIAMLLFVMVINA